MTCKNWHCSSTGTQEMVIGRQDIITIITHITHSYTPLRAITHYCVMMCNEGEDEMWENVAFLAESEVPTPGEHW